MDIDLLAKMVKEAVMDHDSVTLPGMGSFVAELVPASFADRGYTILPPYRRLFFSPKQGDDRLLVQLYAKSNDVSESDAARILEEFLSEMKEVLKARKVLVLTGLGRLRATRENHFFFVADEDLDIYPSGYGLQPISLKTHEETPEEVAAAVSNLATIMESDPVPAETVEPVETAEPVEDVAIVPESGTEDTDKAENEPIVPESGTEAMPETAEPEEAAAPAETVEPKEAAAPAEEAKPEEAKAPEVRRNNRFWKVAGRVALILLALVVLAAVAVAVVGRVAPEWLDGFLYSPEELEILRN